MQPQKDQSGLQPPSPRRTRPGPTAAAMMVVILLLAACEIYQPVLDNPFDPSAPNYAADTPPTVYGPVSGTEFGGSVSITIHSAGTVLDLYRVQFSPESGFSPASIIYDATFEASGTISIPLVPFNGTLYFRLALCYDRIDDRWSPWSEPRLVQRTPSAGNTAPAAAFISVGPMAATAGVPVSIVASATDSEGDAVLFNWYVDGTRQAERGSTLLFVPPASTEPHGYAIGMEATDGAATSATQYLTVNASPPAAVAAPTFDPVEGTYTDTVTVTLSCTTPGAQIRFTTDGFTPTSSYGSVYTGPFDIMTTKSVGAIAYASGMADSPVAWGVYTINRPPMVVMAGDELVSVANGESHLFSASATDPEGDTVTLHWYVDEVLQSEESLPSITVAFSPPVQTDYAIRVEAFDGLTAVSDTATFRVAGMVPTTAVPWFSPSPGTSSGPFDLTLGCDTPGSTIMYTLDGSTASRTNGNPYTAPIHIETTTWVSAMAYAAGYADSAAVGYEYVIDLPPVVSIDGPDSVAVSNGVPITFTTTASDPENATLAYRWFVDGVEQPAKTEPSFTYAEAPATQVTHVIRVGLSDGPNEVFDEVTLTVLAPVPEGGIGLTLALYSFPAVSIVDGVPTIPTTGSMTVSASVSGSTPTWYAWYLDNTLVDEGSAVSSHTVPAGLDPGPYLLTLIVTRDGFEFSENLRFQVVTQ